MTFSYFPGCTLRTKGKDLDKWARLSAEQLGFTLAELPDWQCCGAVHPLAKDEIATRLSSARALISARDLNQDLVTLCSACHHVIKRTNYDLQTDETIRDRVNRYLEPEVPYSGEAKVLHYLEVLRDRIGFDAVAEKVKNPLKGRKIGAYYGCLLLRPSAEMAFDDPENPQILENFIRAIGADPVVYARRNECCGSYAVLDKKDEPNVQAAKIIENAKARGAECLITACPLCMYNLKAAAKDSIPVYYFTELLAEALGVKEATE